MKQSLFLKLWQLIPCILVLALFGSFVLFQSTPTAYAASTVSGLKQAQVVPYVTCSTSDNQSIYAIYNSIKGNVLFRYGYENTPKGLGYGYCHVKAGHPDALPTIDYILQYGHVVAVTSTSFTVRGYYANGLQYQVYIVTSNNGMADGQMRGIVSAYQYTGP